MASFDADLFLWTLDISLRQFVDNYKDHLPTLIRTTSGYRDCSGCTDICSEEVRYHYFTNDISKFLVFTRLAVTLFHNKVIVYFILIV